MTTDIPLDPPARFQRILLKISGEAAIGGPKGAGIDIATVEAVATEIADVARRGVQICLVIGGGNIFRGLAAAAKGMDRASADYMGMLATVMNALAMQDALEKQGVQTRVMSAIAMDRIAEPYIRLRTDEIEALAGCDRLTIAPQWLDKLAADEGTLTRKLDPKASRYDHLSYLDVLSKDLKVMDASAISLMRENGIPIMVFSIREPGALTAVMFGTGVHTMIA